MPDQRQRRGVVDTSVVFDLCRRAFDLLIAATAIAAGLPLYMRNADDFADLSDMLQIVSV